MLKKKNLFNLVADSCFETNNNEQAKPTPFKYRDAENKFKFLLRSLREEAGNHNTTDTNRHPSRKGCEECHIFMEKLQNLLIRITVKNIT